MSYLAFKLSTLFVKQLSKPISKYISRQTLSYPRIKAAIVSAAEAYHRFEVRTALGADGRDTRKVFIGKMQPEKAIEQASHVISEGTLLLIGGGLVYYEFARKKTEDEAKAAKKEARQAEKAEAARTEREAMTGRLEALTGRLELLEAKITDLGELSARPRRRLLGLL